MSAKLLAFVKPAEPIPTVGVRSDGEMLYTMYYVERKQQGWTEFAWDRLDQQQQLVWTRMAEALEAMMS